MHFPKKTLCYILKRYPVGLFSFPGLISSSANAALFSVNLISSGTSQSVSKPQSDGTRRICINDVNNVLFVNITDKNNKMLIKISGQGCGGENQYN